METPPPPPQPLPSSSTTPPENNVPDSSSSNPPENHISDSTEPPPPTTDDSPLPSRKRRRRKKQFPEMISSQAAVNGLRILRQHSKPSSTVYNEKLMDEIIEMQIDDSPSKARRRKMAEEVDIEALIAISVGFPVDSLTEEEIEHNVVSVLGGVEQMNYIIVRNHILARWRSNVNTWLTRDHALEAIRAEHRGLVDKAYSFLLNHGYINFGLAPSIKDIYLGNGGGGGGEKGSVIIIGAGLAGLAAARHLRMFGFKVVIVEGRKRPGGRVRTRKMSGNVGENGEGENVVAAADLGGSVLTGINGNPLGVLARQLGFPLHKVRDICPLYLPDGKAVDSEVDSRVEITFNKLLDKVCKLREAMLEEVNCVDVSLGYALEAFRNTYEVAQTAEERMLLNWHLANLEYANASLLSDLSMAFWDQDDPYEMGGDHCFIPGGNERFVRALADDLPIIYDRTVEKIHYGTDGVLVFSGGQVFKGDMALCTVPLGVLKRGSIEFVPELPVAKKEAIERIGFGLLNKVAMLFPYDFWGGEIDTFGHLTEESSMRGEFFLFYSYSSVSGGPLLVALVAGESAVKFETMSPVDAVNRVLDILKSIFARKGIQVPNPIQVVCTRWGKDIFTYGSYSYVAIGASGDDYDVLAESIGDGRLFFAGEATNRRYPATMHGAFLSGLREASNILRATNKRALAPIGSINNDREENTVKESDTVVVEIDDLDRLFQTPDISFGSFSALFDPKSADIDSTSILRVGFGGTKLASDFVYLYSLILRNQVIELSQVEGDEDRVKMLNNNYGKRLGGKKSLGSFGQSLVAHMKAARIKPDEGLANGATQT